MKSVSIRVDVFCVLIAIAGLLFGSATAGADRGEKAEFFIGEVVMATNVADAVLLAVDTDGDAVPERVFVAERELGSQPVNAHLAKATLIFTGRTLSVLADGAEASWFVSLVPEDEQQELRFATKLADLSEQSDEAPVTIEAYGLAVFQDDFVKSTEKSDTLRIPTSFFLVQKDEFNPDWTWNSGSGGSGCSSGGPNAETCTISGCATGSPTGCSVTCNTWIKHACCACKTSGATCKCKWNLS